MPATFINSVLGLSLLFPQNSPAALKDVPAGHWAHAAVRQVVSRGIMKAPGGKFAGSSPVTRRDLVVTLESFARNLDKGWADAGIKPISKASRDSGQKVQGKVSRYELAAILLRAAGYAGKGIPKNRGTIYGQSEAFPPAPKVTVSPSDPAYASVKYLASRRMLVANSVLLKPGSQHVTPAELTSAVTLLLVGLNDQYTDEPQNREELSPRPHRHPR